MSGWFSGLEGGCSFISVPVHTEKKKKGGIMKLKRKKDLLHSIGFHLTGKKIYLVTLITGATSEDSQVPHNDP